MTGRPGAVPVVQREAWFVPREEAGQRWPLRVTPGAFTAAGLPVPKDPRQWNSYQLTQRRGYKWSPAIDEHVRRRGAELLGGDALLCVDCDTALAVDGTVWLDGMRRLADLASESGSVLDLSGCVTVRTPGRGSHGPGWHLWFRADPVRPVRLGALERCPLIELKNRCTAPGSPGYVVRSLPDGELSILPSWLADLAGPPRPGVIGRTGRSDRTRERLEGVLSFLLEARPGDGRNGRLYWASCRYAEAVAAGELEPAVAERVLYRAAEENGHAAKHGAAQTRATIASGLRQAAVA
jgi:hypothetical protein